MCCQFEWYNKDLVRSENYFLIIEVADWFEFESIWFCIQQKYNNWTKDYIYWMYKMN